MFELEKKLNKLVGFEVMTESSLEFLIFLSPIKKILFIENFLLRKILKKILTFSDFDLTT